MGDTPEPEQVCDDFADDVANLRVRVQTSVKDLVYKFPDHQANQSVVFRVNSAKLAASSQVFRDMLTVGRDGENDTILLDEPPALVKTLLKFIFKPVETINELPGHTSPEALRDCWNMADKYDMIYLQSLIEQYIM